MTDRLSAKGVLEAPLKVAAFGFVGCGIFGVLATQMPNGILAMLFLVPTVFLSNTPYACAGTSIQLHHSNRVGARPMPYLHHYPDPGWQWLAQLWSDL